MTTKTKRERERKLNRVADWINNIGFTIALGLIVGAALKLF